MKIFYRKQQVGRNPIFLKIKSCSSENFSPRRFFIERSGKSLLKFLMSKTRICATSFDAFLRCFLHDAAMQIACPTENVFICVFDQRLIFYFNRSQHFYRYDIFHVCNLFLTSHAHVSHKELIKNRLKRLVLLKKSFKINW